MVFKKICLISFVLCGCCIPGILFIFSFIQSTSTVKGEYETWWSGTESNQNKVNDHAAGKFEITNYFVSGNKILFEYKSNDADSLNIKIWVKFHEKNEKKPYICKYEIKADYSSLEEDDIKKGIPSKINGSGQGSWDWKDRWIVRVNQIKIPENIWGLEENLIVGNLIYFVIIGMCLIYYYLKLDEQ